MQTSELEKIKNHLLGDEECITFRPSPNFKHMKKYLKSKFEESNSSSNHSSDQSTTPNSEDLEPVKPQQFMTNGMAQRKQPPLPPNSPPMNTMVLKQEIEDEEYNDKTPTKPKREGHFKTEKEDISEKPPEKTMCRQFARGTCNRGASCIYAHELILSQLPGVYTFCKNFQNTVCNFPKCKFVHATVFEKEHYYRTGFLPPHTLVHLKDSNSALAPPTALEATPAEATPMFLNPPPAMQPGVSALPTSGSIPPETRPNTEIYGVNGHSLSPVPVKRDWNGLELGAEAGVSGKEAETEPKCKFCDINEFKEQYLKKKLGDYFETTVALTKHSQALALKEKRLMSIAEIMQQSQCADTINIANKIKSTFNNSTSQKQNEGNMPLINMLLDLRTRRDFDKEKGPELILLVFQLLKMMRNNK